LSDIALKKTKIGGANRSTFRPWSIYVYRIEGLLYSHLNAFIIIFNPENMGIETCLLRYMHYWPRYSQKHLFSNGGTNLHKRHTWDILTTF